MPCHRKLQTDLYADNPLTSEVCEKWTVKYHKDVDADTDLEQTSNNRFEGNIVVNEWQLGL